MARSRVSCRYVVLGAALLAVGLAFVGVQVPGAAATVRVGGSPVSAGTYRNPVLPVNAADPSVVKGLDGYYYLYATTTRLPGSDRQHYFPVWRSTDLTSWSYVTDAMTAKPDWAADDSLWAPDVHYLNGKYYLYYTAAHVKALPAYGTPGTTPAHPVSAIGVATSSTPWGPFQDAGPSAGGGYVHGPVVPPRYGFGCTDRANPACYNWVFDSFVYQGPDGRRWIYDGSYFGGNVLHELTPDGLHLVPGTGTQFGHNIKYEASYVVPHTVDGTRYYYMLNSSSDCCVGADSPYSVVANRSTNPNGQFSDQLGNSMELSYGPVKEPSPDQSPFDNPTYWNLGGDAGGYPVLKQNGNGINGPGGQAVATDLSGQDWLAYHGVEQADPWIANSPEGGLRRQLYIDPLDWTADGWPTVNDGAGPGRSGRAPVTVPLLGDNGNTATSGAPQYRPNARVDWRRWSGTSHAERSAVNGGYERLSPNAVVFSSQRVAASRPLRAECDVRAAGSARGRYGCGFSGHDTAIGAVIDARTRTLTVGRYVGNSLVGSAKSAQLPPSFDTRDWAHLVVELDPGGHLSASLQNQDRQPLADAAANIGSVPDRLGLALATQGTSADFDNVSVAFQQTHVAPSPTPPSTGTLDTARSDDFGGAVSPRWSWLREDPARHGFSPGGALSLTSNGNLDEWQRLNADAKNPPDLPPTKNLLLQGAPGGDYAVETRMHFDPQTPNLAAGLMIYSDDDTNVSAGIAWNGTSTMVTTIRNELHPVSPTTPSCPLAAPMTGANVAVTAYSTRACPATAEHTSQEFPVNQRAWSANGEGPTPTFAGGNQDPSRVTVTVRIYRHGDVYTPWYTVNGSTWYRANAWTLKPSSPAFPLRIGLFAQNNQQVAAAGAQAWFDYVHVYR
jgi:arabinan endo-1,5-alpha-L-arabinosidase